MAISELDLKVLEAFTHLSDEERQELTVKVLAFFAASKQLKGLLLEWRAMPNTTPEHLAACLCPTGDWNESSANLVLEHLMELK